MDMIIVKSVEELMPSTRYVIMRTPDGESVVTHKSIIVCQWEYSIEAMDSTYVNRMAVSVLKDHLDSPMGEWLADHKIGPFRAMRYENPSNLTSRFVLAVTLSGQHETYFKMKYR